MARAESPQPYPLRIEIPYPHRQSRVSVLLRAPLSVPVLFFAVLLNIGAPFALWAAILVRGRAPQWLFDFQVGVSRWQVRAAAFVLLLRDEYPSFEGEQAVAYVLPGPHRVSRWQTVVWKFITAIPHALALLFVALSLIPVTILAWVMILARGQYPARLHAYSGGALRWAARVQAYVLSLTDAYPPFSLARAPSLAGPRARTAGVAGGFAVVAVGFGLLGLLAAFGGTHSVREVPYEMLIRGELDPRRTAANVESGQMMIVSAHDPADDLLRLLPPQTGARLVAFEVSIHNYRGAGENVPVKANSFSLEDSAGDKHSPILVGVNGVPGDGGIGSGERGRALLVFEVPREGPPRKLTWDVVDYIQYPRVGETIDWIFR